MPKSTDYNPVLPSIRAVVIRRWDESKINKGFNPQKWWKDVAAEYNVNPEDVRRICNTQEALLAHLENPQAGTASQRLADISGATEALAMQRLMEGLSAERVVRDQNGKVIARDPDHAVRIKYIGKALEVWGSAPSKEFKIEHTVRRLDHASDGEIDAALRAALEQAARIGIVIERKSVEGSTPKGIEPANGRKDRKALPSGSSVLASERDSDGGRTESWSDSAIPGEAVLQADAVGDAPRASAVRGEVADDDDELVDGWVRSMEGLSD